MYPALTHPALTHRDASQSQEARRLFWEWLETEHYTKDGHATHGWDRNDPTTWTDESMGEGQELGRGGDGVMGAGIAQSQLDSFCQGTKRGCRTAAHCDAFWYVRTLPGIIGGFAAAYGTDDLVTAFDRMSVQRPSTCGSEAVQSIKRGDEAFDQRHLHTHFNQDVSRHDVAGL